MLSFVNLLLWSSLTWLVVIGAIFAYCKYIYCSRCHLRDICKRRSQPPVVRQTPRPVYLPTAFPHPRMPLTYSMVQFYISQIDPQPRIDVEESTEISIVTVSDDETTLPSLEESTQRNIVTVSNDDTRLQWLTESPPNYETLEIITTQTSNRSDDLPSYSLFAASCPHRGLNSTADAASPSTAEICILPDVNIETPSDEEFSLLPSSNGQSPSNAGII